MAWSIALYLALILALDSAQLSVQGNQPQDASPVIAMKGRSVILLCPADKEVTRDRIAWIRQSSRTIISLHGELVTQSNKYAIIDKAGGAYDLKLLEVDFEDEGIYICQINTVPMQNHIIRLIVVMSPQFQANLTSSSTISVKEGDSIRLACPVRGVPSPKVFWRTPKDRKMTFKYPSETYFEERVSRKHHGKYTCIAKNGYPPSVAKTFHVSVQYAPMIKVYTNLNSSGLCVGCHIEAEPWPTELYLEEQGQVIARQEKKFEHLEACNIGFSTLDRRFVCNAANTMGLASKSLLVPGREFAEEENNQPTSNLPMPRYPATRASTTPQRYRQITSTVSPRYIPRSSMADQPTSLLPGVALGLLVWSLGVVFK